MTPWVDMPLNPATGKPVEPRRWQREALPQLVEAVRRREKTVCVAATGSGKSVLIAELCHLALRKAAADRVVVVATPSQNLVRQLSKTIALRCGAANVGQFYGKKKQADRRVIVVCYPSVAALNLELAARGRRVALLVVDECHKSEGETTKVALPALQPSGWVGLTATPFRSVDTESLSLWDSLAYRYTMADALADGVLVPFRIVNWDGTGNETGDTDAVCADLIARHGAGPGIVSATSIADAEAYADYLVERGVPAEAIHSELGEAEQERRIERLRAGELRCLVHVAMLAEGVDYPWLRWLCLRRPVSARVRLVQEVGRVIRVDEGTDKRFAILIDPHDLMGTIGIPSVEAIGQALQDEVDEAEERRKRDPNAAPEVKELPAAKAIDEATRWARMLLLGMQASGLAPSDSVTTDHWRTRRPSDRQIDTLANLARHFARYLPEGQREAVKALARPEVAAGLQRGAVSDLISVLKAVANTAPAWPERKVWRMDWPTDALVEPPPPAVVACLPLVDRATGEPLAPARGRKVA